MNHDVSGAVTSRRGEVVVSLGDVETTMTPAMAQKLSFILQRHARKAEKGYTTV